MMMVRAATAIEPPGPSASTGQGGRGNSAKYNSWGCRPHSGIATAAVSTVSSSRAAAAAVATPSTLKSARDCTADCTTAVYTVSGARHSPGPRSLLALGECSSVAVWQKQLALAVARDAVSAKFRDYAMAIPRQQVPAQAGRAAGSCKERARVGVRRKRRGKEPAVQPTIPAGPVAFAGPGGSCHKSPCGSSHAAGGGPKERASEAPGAAGRAMTPVPGVAASTAPSAATAATNPAPDMAASTTTITGPNLAARPTAGRSKTPSFEARPRTGGCTKTAAAAAARPRTAARSKTLTLLDVARSKFCADADDVECTAAKWTLFGAEAAVQSRRPPSPLPPITKPSPPKPLFRWAPPRTTADIDAATLLSELPKKPRVPRLGHRPRTGEVGGTRRRRSAGSRSRSRPPSPATRKPAVPRLGVQSRTDRGGAATPQSAAQSAAGKAPSRHGRSGGNNGAVTVAAAEATPAARGGRAKITAAKPAAAKAKAARAEVRKDLSNDSVGTLEQFIGKYGGSRTAPPQEWEIAPAVPNGKPSWPSTTKAKKKTKKAGGHSGSRQPAIMSAAELGMDEATWRLLRDLQTRDITPNDYNVLVELDNRVKTKGVDGTDKFPTATVCEANGGASQDNTEDAVDVRDSAGRIHRLEDTECRICFDTFDAKQVVRRINCGHVFHAECIDKWLECNTTCPIDRKELEPPTSAGAGSAGAPAAFDYAAPCSLCKSLNQFKVGAIPQHTTCPPVAVK